MQISSLRPRRLAASGCAVIVILAGVAAGVSSAATQRYGAAHGPSAHVASGTGSQRVVNRNNGYCLTDQGGASYNGAPVDLESCTGALTQKWFIYSLGYGDWSMENSNSNLCLWNLGHSNTNGGSMVQETCNSSDQSDQVFFDHLTCLGGGVQSFGIKMLGTNQYVEERGLGLGVEPVDHWGWNGGQNQEWVNQPGAGC